MARNGLNLYFYDRRRVQHASCAVAWKRSRGVFYQNRVVLLFGVQPPNTLLVWCEEKYFHRREVRNLVKNVVVVEILGGGGGGEADTVIFLINRCRLRNCVLELEVQRALLHETRC